MEYQQIVAATGRQLTDEERDIEVRQAEVDTAQRCSTGGGGR